MAVEKGDADAMNGLAWFYFLNIKAKAETLKLVGQSVKLSKNVHNTYILAICALWHDRDDESIKDERYRLRERIKPVYYALMQRMRDEYPKEYKKMGENLRQTVEEILAEADKLARDYA